MPGLEVKGAKRHCLLDPSTPDLRGKGKQRWKGREGPYFLSWLCLCSDLISLSPGPGFEAKLKYFSELCLSRKVRRCLIRDALIKRQWLMKLQSRNGRKVLPLNIRIFGRAHSRRFQFCQIQSRFSHLQNVTR